MYVDIDATVRIIYSISTAPRVYPVYIGVEKWKIQPLQVGESIIIVCGKFYVV